MRIHCSYPHCCGPTEDTYRGRELCKRHTDQLHRGEPHVLLHCGLSPPAVVAIDGDWPDDVLKTVLAGMAEVTR